MLWISSQKKKTPWDYFILCVKGVDDKKKAKLDLHTTNERCRHNMVMVG